MSADPAALPDPLAADLHASEESPGFVARHSFQVTLLVIAIAIASRLLYLFLGGDPENAGDGMTDTYHHWQIGYLTWQIGLNQGFRLWDLKGLEYFWGLLHPAILVALFAVTRSIDIVIPRLVSIAFGSLSAGLLFQICRRFWGEQVAIAAAAFAALAPPLIFSDSLGMVEPVSVAFVLLGIFSWPGGSFITGVSWGFAAMARAEAWGFTLGLVIASWLRRISFERFLPLLVGWAVVMGLYMKFMLDHTGNPIYPVYWEFLVEVTGRWLGPAVSSEAHAVQPLFVGLVLLSAVGLLISLWKRPPSLLLLCYGFGSSAFVMGLLAFTPFLTSWSGWVWRLRVLAFPLDFAFVLLSLLVFLLFRSLSEARGSIAAWTVLAASLLSIQLTWLPIQQAYWQTQPTWRSDLAVGREIGSIYHQPEHQWGRLNIPADQPTLTYTLARFAGVRGDQIIGQLYDPFYSLPADTRYEQDPQSIGRSMACWLRDTKTSIFLTPDSNRNYAEFIADHAAWFDRVARIGDRGWSVWAITSPQEIASACTP